VRILAGLRTGRERSDTIRIGLGTGDVAVLRGGVRCLAEEPPWRLGRLLASKQDDRADFDEMNETYLAKFPSRCLRVSPSASSFAG
jgi:hypothetical protein